MARRGLFVLAVLAAAPLAAQAEEPVRLKVAYGQTYAVSGSSFSWTTIDASVMNIAYEKSVVMLYRDLADSTWKEFPLTFKGHYGTYDVFGSSNAPVTDQFVLRYAVPGQTYWDNNGGADYHIATFKGVVGGNVMLKDAVARIGHESGGGFTFTTSWFESQIYVRNLSYHKRVGVRWSADGGAQWEDTDGSYAGKVQAVANVIDDIEIWKVKTPTYNLNPASPSFRFAVYYEERDAGADLGKQYWDNNFSQDYTLGKLDGTMIQ